MNPRRLVLLVAIVMLLGGLFIWKLAKRPVATVSAYTATAVQTPESFPTPLPSSPTPVSSNRIRRDQTSSQTTADQASIINALTRDEDQLRQQILGMAPGRLDDQLNLRKQDLIGLQAQMNQYQQALQNLDQQANTAVQFKSVVRQSSLDDIDSRIRIQERLIQTTREQMANASLNPFMYDQTLLNMMQTQLTTQEQDYNALLLQRGTISAQSMNEITQLNNQTVTSRNSISTAINAIQNQIQFVQQDISRMQQEQNNTQTLTEQYQREINQIEEQLRNLVADQRPLKTLTFPGPASR